MNFERNRLSLCVDIDGTVTGAYDWLEYTNRYFNRNISEEEVRIYDIDQLYGISRREYEDFYHLFGEEIHRNNTPRDLASKVLHQLYASGHEIHFVTARNSQMEQITKNWLSNHQMPFDSLNMLGSHYKVEKALELHCDIFVEDRYENALELGKAGFLVLLLDCNYNQGPLPSSVIRLKDWQEIDRIIQRYISFYFQQKIAN